MAFIKKLAASVASVFVAAGLITVGTASTAGACTPDRVFAVGGVNDGGAPWASARGYHVVHYSGNLNAMEEGIGNLKGAVDAFKRQCPGSRVIIAGYSQGAAISHEYLSRHGGELGRGAAVLFADPKRPGGQSDFLFQLGGVPIAGTNANYGGVPTVQVCFLDDVICNSGAPSGWIGYINGLHGNYDFNVWKYAGGNGEVLYW